MKLSIWITALYLSMVDAQEQGSSISGAINVVESETDPMIPAQEEYSSIAGATDNMESESDAAYEAYMLSMAGDFDSSSTSTVAQAWSKAPEEGATINMMEFPVWVQVDRSIVSVMFQFDNLDGTSSEWKDGENESGSNIFSISLSSYLGAGQYAWRFKTMDSSNAELTSDDITFSVDQEATPFGSIAGMIAGKVEQRKILAEDLVKLSYQDCLVKCDGCVDLVHGDPNKLEPIIDSLENIVNYAQEDLGISRADTWALAGTVGAFMARSNAKAQESFPLRYSGRLNCERIVPYCTALDGGVIMCGAKAAPVYDDAGGAGVSMMASTAEYGKMSSQNLNAVQDHGDSDNDKPPQDECGPGPCRMSNNGPN
mmetsp:Transcript_5850/g.6700  ORF Transcript_5850/g.6700 Transcript_5850/m.6700 type:complete len:370 (+) Transcript_5850:208-1317(+)